MIAASLLLGGVLVVVVSGLLTRTSARWPGWLLLLGGLLLVAAAVLVLRHRQPDLPAVLAGQAAGLAVLAYPRFPREPASVLAAVSVLGFPPVALYAGLGGTTSALLCVAMVPLAQLWWRLEQGEPSRPLLWVMAAVLTLSTIGSLAAFIADVSTADVMALYFPWLFLLPLAALVGAARPDAIDVRGISSVVAINLTAALGVFTLFELAWVCWTLATGHEMSPAGAGAVAVACAFGFEPGRRQLRLVSDELLFGVRPDPLAAVRRFAVGVGDDPAAALDAVRSALVLPYLALRVAGAPVSESGEPVEHTQVITLVLNEQPAGELTVGLRPGDLRLPAADIRVLELAGPLLAQTARAHALAERLQEARHIAANAREDERMRLRRDLHDGLGPLLSGIAFRADAARLSVDEPAALEEHLASVRAEAVTAIRGIRELVYGMRPPSLDEVGLLEALRLAALSLRTADGRPMRIDVAATALPELPAATEVAVYRIVVEALTNAARHSGSDVAHASLGVRDGLFVAEVCDEGVGRESWRPGVGMSSMRERAQELGGSLLVADGVVRAELPLG